MVRRHRNILDFENKPFERVPIELEPCQLKAWMESHDTWALDLDKMTTEELRDLYLRHVESPCPNDEVLSEIGSHANTPLEILVELSKPRWRAIHFDLAQNPNLLALQLRRLARSHRHGVLRAVAEHPNTPMDELGRLAIHSRDEWVRDAAQRALKKRLSSPDEIRSEDEEEEFPDVPIDLEPCQLRDWMDSHDSWFLSLDDTMSPGNIRILYLQHIESPCPVIDVISEIANHPNTPPDILAELSQPIWREVHPSLAANPSLTVEIVRRLAKSNRCEVLEHLALNPKTPVDILRRIAARSKPWFAVQVAKHELKRREQATSETE